jgi:hypothetical protein
MDRALDALPGGRGVIITGASVMHEQIKLGAATLSF